MVFVFSADKIRLETSSINRPAHDRREQVGELGKRGIRSRENLPDLGVRLDFDVDAPIVVGREELRLRAGGLEILSELLGLAEGGAKGSETLIYFNFRRSGGVIFAFIICQLLRLCIFVVLLPHYHTTT